MPSNRKAIAEPCKSCNMECCNRFRVPLTVFDVGRIAKHEGLEMGEFCELVDAQEVESPPHSEIFIFDKKGRLGCKLLVLAKSKGTCRFFKAGIGCTIHGSHPMACRIYPFVLGGESGIRYNSHFICPKKWSLEEGEKRKMLGLLEQTEYEIFLHNKKVRKWNAARAANGGGILKFLSFTNPLHGKIGGKQIGQQGGRHNQGRK